MAKSQSPKSNRTDVTVETKKSVATINYERDAGGGMEGTDAQSFAIPFLGILQKGSPQIEDGNAKFVKGARAGMFFNTVTQCLYEGKDTGVILVPVAYQRRFIRWSPRDIGGGYRGEFKPEEVSLMRADKRVVDMDGYLFFPAEDGSVHEKKSDRLADTRNHYCLLIDPKTGTYDTVLFSLASTQVKKSKHLMSMLSSIKFTRSDKTPYTPPTYANKVRATTVLESNDQGSWYGVKFEIIGAVQETALYVSAKEFHNNVIKGIAHAAPYEPTTAGATQESASTF